MSYQPRKIPAAVAWVGAWFFACAVFFVLCHTAGNSFLPLYEGIEIQNPVTRFLILLMERNWTARLVLLAAGAVALISAYTFQRRKPAR